MVACLVWDQEAGGSSPPSPTIIAELADEKYISLTTFRKSGEPVRTAVWFANLGNDYCIVTETDAGKVKRIRGNQQIEVQICDRKGGVKPDTPTFAGTARLVTGDEAIAVRKVIGRRYGIRYRLFAIYLTVSGLFKKRVDLDETNIVITLTV